MSIGGSSASSEDEQSPTPTISCIANGMLQANCYLLICPETGEALLVDPGAEPERILQHIRDTGCRITRIVHTHGHFDHISATEAVLAGLDAPVPVAAHPADLYLYKREARARGLQFGYPLPETLVLPQEQLDEGGELRCGKLRLGIIHTPGHTPGSISLICGTTSVLTGDTLFRHGIGRTDLEGGDEEAIYSSILNRLYSLAESLMVFPGHGPGTTIGEERRSNPFVQAV
jgi:hydroxyacylglutathione hydrolase